MTRASELAHVGANGNGRESAGLAEKSRHEPNVGATCANLKELYHGLRIRPCCRDVEGY